MCLFGMCGYPTRSRGTFFSRLLISAFAQGIFISDAIDAVLGSIGIAPAPDVLDPAPSLSVPIIGTAVLHVRCMHHVFLDAATTTF